MTEPVGANGLSDELGPVDYLLHRGEANPRTRSGIMALELLDTTPDWNRFRTRFENASRKVLRLRQKVVVPTLPTAAPLPIYRRFFCLNGLAAWRLFAIAGRGHGGHGGHGGHAR